MVAVIQPDGSIVHIDPAKEMAAFDALPPGLKKIMNECLNPPPAVLVRQWLPMLGEANIVQMIRQADAEFHREGVASGWVYDDFPDRKRGNKELR